MLSRSLQQNLCTVHVVIVDFKLHCQCVNMKWVVLGQDEMHVPNAVDCFKT